MVRSLSIAVCQLESVHGDVEQNATRMAAFVEQAAACHADIIVFPEFALTGLAVADAPHLAEETDKYIARVCQASARLSIDVCAGFVEQRQLHARDDALINVAYYISKGKILSRYVKKNLWHPERDYLEPGNDERTTFKADKFVGGLLVCWDLAWPEAARTLAMQGGAEVLLVPTCWMLDDVGELGIKHDPQGANECAWLDAMTITRAYENECVVIFVNAGGKRKDGFLGRSAVTMPFKGVVARFEEPEERMEIVEIDLDVLEDAQKTYKIREDYVKRQNARKQQRQATLSQ